MQLRMYDTKAIQRGRFIQYTYLLQELKCANLACSPSRRVENLDSVGQVTHIPVCTVANTSQRMRVCCIHRQQYSRMVYMSLFIVDDKITTGCCACVRLIAVTSAAAAASTSTTTAAALVVLLAFLLFLLCIVSELPVSTVRRRLVLIGLVHSPCTDTQRSSARECHSAIFLNICCQYSSGATQKSRFFSAVTFQSPPCSPWEEPDPNKPLSPGAAGALLLLLLLPGA